MKRYELKHTDVFELALADTGYELNSVSEYASQFKNCQAWEVEAELVDKTTGELVECEALQSYETLVAVILPNGTLLRGKYSPTTSKQITQWSHQFRFNSTITF